MTISAKYPNILKQLVWLQVVVVWLQAGKRLVLGKVAPLGVTGNCAAHWEVRCN